LGEERAGGFVFLRKICFNIANTFHVLAFRTMIRTLPQEKIENGAGTTLQICSYLFQEYPEIVLFYKVSLDGEEDSPLSMEIRSTLVELNRKILSGELSESKQEEEIGSLRKMGTALIESMYSQMNLNLNKEREEQEKSADLTDS
jgi:hypothetical protein